MPVPAILVGSRACVKGLPTNLYGRKNADDELIKRTGSGRIPDTV